LVDGCQECIAPVLQDNLGGKGDAAQGYLAATLYTIDDNIGSTHPSTHKKEKTHQYTHSGGIQGNPSNSYSTKIVVKLHRAKEK
jgi:hypothetical protein